LTERVRVRQPFNRRQLVRRGEVQRMLAVGGLVILMAALAAWVIFLWPAYWD